MHAVLTCRSSWSSRVDRQARSATEAPRSSCGHTRRRHRRRHAATRSPRPRDRRAGTRTRRRARAADESGRQGRIVPAVPKARSAHRERQHRHNQASVVAGRTLLRLPWTTAAARRQPSVSDSAQPVAQPLSVGGCWRGDGLARRSRSPDLLALIHLGSHSIWPLPLEPDEPRTVSRGRGTSDTRWRQFQHITVVPVRIATPIAERAAPRISDTESRRDSSVVRHQCRW
jgi:hypothetical protein